MDISQVDFVSFDMTPQTGIIRSEEVHSGDPAGRPPEPPLWIEGADLDADPDALSNDRTALNAWLDAHARLPLALSPQTPLGPYRLDDHLTRRLGAAPPQGEAITEAVADPSLWPLSALGRLTVGRGDKRRFCTGFVIAEHIVVTAAHCLIWRDLEEPGAVAADWTVFEPQAVANEVAGRWQGVRGYVWSGWMEGAPDAALGPLDFALVVLDRPIAGRTGALGLATGLIPDEAVTSLGYPRISTNEFVFDGRFLFASTGALTQWLEGQMIAQNGLTEGSSGGPWISMQDNELMVVGLNAAKPVGEDDTTFSPRLDEDFLALLSRVLADLTGV